MPGPSTHILIAEEITKKLEGMESWPFQIAGLSTNGNSPAELHRILNENSHYSAQPLFVLLTKKKECYLK